MKFPFLKYSKIYYIFSGLLALGVVISIFFFGLKLGIDFTGGSILEADFASRPENSLIQEKIKDLALGEVVIQPTKEKGVIFRMKEIDERSHQVLLSKLGELSSVQEKRFESIGPVIGKELREKTLLLIAISLGALLLYIAFSFRKVAGRVSGWQYGLISILSLAFDALIPVGLLSLLGKFYDVQLNIPIVAALLTILGYTINDKVVVFDRIRENLVKDRSANFKEIVNRSLNQTLARSLTTGFCTILVLSAIFFFGGDTLKYFSLILIVGIAAGTYSSIFLASPLLAGWISRKK